MKKYFLLLAFFISLSLYARDTQEHLSLPERLLELSTKAELDLVDFEIFPGGSFAAGYEFEVEPAFTKGLYSRRDTWQVSLKAGASTLNDITEGIDYKLSGGVYNQTELTFYRFFNKYKDAYLTLPYTFRNLPLTAKNTLSNRFEVGEYFQLKSTFGTIVSLEMLKVLNPNFGATIGANYFAEAGFQTQIIKLDNRRVRLKVTTRLGRGHGATLDIGYTGILNIFSIDKLNEALEKYLIKTPLKFDLSKSYSQIILSDYILDLSDDEVAQVFDTMFIEAKSVRGLAQVFRNRGLDIDSNIVLDLTRLEELYQRDLAGGQLSRIKRNLRTHSRQETQTIRARIENLFFKYSSQKDISTAFMQLQQVGNEWEYYIFRSWGEESKLNLFYTWQSRNVNRTQALFSTDKDFKNLSPVNIVRNIQQKDNSLSENEFRLLERRLLKMLPTGAWEKMDLSSWRGEKHKNFGMKLQIVLSPAVFDYLPHLSVAQIKTAFREFMERKNLVARDYFMDDPTGRPTAEEILGGAIHKFSLEVAKVLNPKLSMSERFESLTFLRKNHLFRDSGLAFLSDLLGENVENHFHVDLYLSTNHRELVVLHGDSEASYLYKKLLSIKSSLDNETYDILLEAESLNQDPLF